MAVDWLGLYLLEDLGAGDITTDAVFPAHHKIRARIVAREPLVVSGAAHAAEIFQRLGAAATVLAQDGARVKAGSELVAVEGPTRAVMAGERLALNILGRMSGIASLTRDLQDQLVAAGSSARVAGTRKTTPGFRFFEKQAIVAGGGDPHRFDLGDMAMIKDNHREAAGGVVPAIEAVATKHPAKAIECEVESLADALAAAEAGAHWILVDNQPPEVGRAWAEAVWKRHPGVRIEASGGIGPERVVAFGWANRISMGYLTQKSQGKDVSLEWVKNL